MLQLGLQLLLGTLVLKDDWWTLVLLDILNVINIANLWPMHVTTMAYLKNSKILHFPFFLNSLALSPRKKS